MLIIRKEQMKVFERQIENNFINTVVEKIRSDHANATNGLPDNVLRKRIEYGLQRAGDYGLTWQNNLITFVTMMFEIGVGFDNCPVFQKHLTDQSLPPNARMEQLLKQTDYRDWEEAQRDSADNPWPEDVK